MYTTMKKVFWVLAPFLSVAGGSAEAEKQMPRVAHDIPPPPRQIVIQSDIGNNAAFVGTLNVDLGLNNKWKLSLLDNCDLQFTNETENRVRWHSNTPGQGKDCKLILTDTGSLTIVTGNGNQIEVSKSIGPVDSYRLIVNYGGLMVVPTRNDIWPYVGPWPHFGPSWEQGTYSPSVLQHSLFEGDRDQNIHQLTVGNHIFSKNGLFWGEMRPDCNFVVYGSPYPNTNNVTWQSGTAGKESGSCSLVNNDFGLIVYGDKGPADYTSIARVDCSGTVECSTFITDDGDFGVYDAYPIETLWSVRKGYGPPPWHPGNLPPGPPPNPQPVPNGNPCPKGEWWNGTSCQQGNPP